MSGIDEGTRGRSTDGQAEATRRGKAGEGGEGRLGASTCAERWKDCVDGPAEGSLRGVLSDSTGCSVSLIAAARACACGARKGRTPCKPLRAKEPVYKAARGPPDRLRRSTGHAAPRREAPKSSDAPAPTSSRRCHAPLNAHSRVPLCRGLTLGCEERCAAKRLANNYFLHAICRDIVWISLLL